MGGAWGFFPYEAMDYKAAQACLDRRAAAGWVLKKVHLNVLARFEPCEGRSHFVDLDLRRTLDETDPDYLQLCADAGWEKVQSLRGMLLFRSRPGTHPAPIQRDPGMEWERFWKQYVLKNLLVSGVVLLAAVLWLVLLAAALPSSGSALAPGVASNGSLLYGLMLVLMVLQLLWRGAATLAYFRACRKTGGLAVPGRGAALRGGLALAVSVLLICAGGLCIAESLGLNQTVDLAWTSFYPEYTATVEACRTYPVVMGDLRLSGSKVSFSELSAGQKREERIACANAGERNLKITVMPAFLPSWISVRTEPETIAPGKTGDIVICVDVDKIGMLPPSCKVSVILEGIAGRPSDRSIEVTVER